MYITEWGAGGNPGGMGGTIGFEAANDWFLNQISGYLGIAAICKFNGASITGYITSKITCSLFNKISILVF